MALSTGKGKEKAIDLTEEADSSDSVSSSGSDSDSSDSDSEPEITQEYLDSLLEKAKQNAIASSRKNQEAVVEFKENEAEIITLDDDSQPPLPQLNPGKLPPPYIELGESRLDGPSSIRDPDVEIAEKASSSRTVPAPPLPPPEITKTGKPLTKKEKKELKARTTGKDWFDMPAPPEAELPRLHREVEALRLRNQLDPKRFYRKDEGEGKGIKGLPKYFAIGTILPSSTPFGTASGDNLTRANRKRTLVDELVDDAEAKRYAKKKFEELQSVRGTRGKNTLHAKRAMRKGKF
ncbi:Fcf2 pre-rRNA processing-domain-containing protein [Crucibulum laeve]|uniref:Fcf2 pre-rRNA processing-domain-containing protein n=1 Tax=Crucibulum laeve TaxID=68775 RepID=A0A5C3M7G0_9AGAR|nr:Fcf2 pre-rRNA processing-domain-containing protein [Crucibulum laeve]